DLVGHHRAEEAGDFATIELVTARAGGRGEMGGAGVGDDVVLVDAVAADADGADEFSILIKRDAAGEDGDAVLQGGFEIQGGEESALVVGAEAELVLEIAQGADAAVVDAGGE